MSFRCLFGFHRVSTSSIVARPGGYAGLCEVCARPLERQARGEWFASEPLDQPKRAA
jgi:hypothetical protein